MKSLMFLGAVLLCAGCSGGSNLATTAIPTTAPTAVPSPIVSPTPGASPTVAPSNSPAAIQNIVSNAPLTSAPALTPSSLRRIAQTLAPPTTVVESSGTAAIVAGTFVTWASSPITHLDVPEASLNIAATNALPISNPGPTPLSCITSITSPQWCSAHPTGWYYGTDSGINTKPVGKQTITIAFGDGSTGTVTDYVYNGWLMACGQSLAYQNGVMATVSSNAADVTYDCTNNQVIFPHGVVTAAASQTDIYGRTETVLPTVTAAVVVPNGSPTAISFATFSANSVLVFGTTDGGFAKMYAGSPGGSNWTAASLHSQVNGSFAY